jgi:hypothetical protein
MLRLMLGRTKTSGRCEFARANALHPFPISMVNRECTGSLGIASRSCTSWRPYVTAEATIGSAAAAQLLSSSWRDESVAVVVVAAP